MGSSGKVWWEWEGGVQTIPQTISKILYYTAIIYKLYCFLLGLPMVLAHTNIVSTINCNPIICFNEIGKKYQLVMGLFSMTDIN